MSGVTKTIYLTEENWRRLRRCKSISKAINSAVAYVYANADEYGYRIAKLKGRI